MHSGDGNCEALRFVGGRELPIEGPVPSDLVDHQTPGHLDTHDHRHSGRTATHPAAGHHRRGTGTHGVQEVFSLVGHCAMLNGSLHRTPPKESGNLGLVAVVEAICLRHQDA